MIFGNIITIYIKEAFIDIHIRIYILIKILSLILTYQGMVDNLLVLNKDKAIQDLGDEELYITLMKNFTNSLLTLLGQLQNAMNTFAYKEIKLASHSLKGTSLYIGAEKFSNAAKIVQDSTDTQDGPAIYKNYPKLIEESIKLRKEIRSCLCRQESKKT